MRERDLFKLRGRIGMVFQESALFDSLSVADNVAFACTKSASRKTRSTTASSRPSSSSSWNKPSTSFPPSSPEACAAASPSPAPSSPDPDLILYDSPTGGLDPITSTTIIELVIKQRDVTHTTSLLITHRLQDAFLLARNRFNQQTGQMEPIPDGGVDNSTKFLVLNEGRIVFDGTTRELIGTEDPWLKEYIT